MQPITRQLVQTYADEIAKHDHTDVKVGDWQSPLNAYEPWDRRYATAVGYVIRYTTGALLGRYADQVRYVLAGEPVRNWTGDAFLIDDGETVKVYYVGAYRLDGAKGANTLECDPHLILCPFTPTNRQTSYQLLAPRKCHHVRVAL